MGLATLVCDLGATRLGTCSEPPLRQRLRRHLAQPVTPLLLRPVLLARQRGRRSAPAARPPCRTRRRRTGGGRRVNDGPLIVQSDKTLLLEVDHPSAPEARKAIAPFAELERSPEHIHTYRLTPLGLWNARAAGHDAEQVVDALLTWSRYAVPHALLVDVAETMGRYGRLRWRSTRPRPRAVVGGPPRPRGGAAGEEDRRHGRRPPRRRHGRGAPERARQPQAGPAQARLAGRGLRGYVDGEAHAIDLAEDGWTLRPYQRDAAQSFWDGGSGVVVLPCGAGKTIVGAAAMAHAGATTLILVTNTVSARQWKDELVARTSLTADEIGEYSGAVKEVRPVTIATYQVLTTRRKGVYPHLELLDARDWGLIVYDEVHLLPAPIFRMTADLQARRRLGLTAHPGARGRPRGRGVLPHRAKRFDAPWKDIEARATSRPPTAWRSGSRCPTAMRLAYATSDPDTRYRLASCTHAKIGVVRDLVRQHAGQPRW